MDWIYEQSHLVAGVILINWGFHSPLSKQQQMELIGDVTSFKVGNSVIISKVLLLIIMYCIDLERTLVLLDTELFWEVWMIHGSKPMNCYATNLLALYSSAFIAQNVALNKKEPVHLRIKYQCRGNTQLVKMQSRNFSVSFLEGLECLTFIN